MRIIKVIMICVCTLCVVTLSYAKEWRGIVPLHSTREDVKRLLGPSAQPGERFYEFDDEVAVIQYASGSCVPGGWNVPLNTVLSIAVTPKSRLQLTDLGADFGRYKKSVDPKFGEISYYNDEEDGVTLQVSNEQVTRIFYEPAVVDKHLRCTAGSPAVPMQNGSTADPPDKIDEFGNIPLKEEGERLDHLARLLQELPDKQGYLIVYAGRCARLNEARMRAERAKDYLASERGIQASRIVAIAGGHREKLTVEIWLGSRSGLAPALMPTVDPGDVQIIREDNGRNSNRRSPPTRRKRRQPCQ